MSNAYEFISTEPDTSAAAYLRHYWQPVYESNRLSKGQAVLIKIMNERFTLFRGDGGQVRLVSPQCPHRNTQLSTGWVEGDSIRCLYHGWRFDGEGKCIEQPAEPKPFCAKISIKSYPTAEQMGLIFAYLGPLPCPPLPRWPELEQESHVSSLQMIPCNYFQSAENIVDYVHPGFVHGGGSKSEVDSSGRMVPSMADARVDVEVEETEYGIRIYEPPLAGVEETYYMMPNVAYVSYNVGNVTPGKRSTEYRMRSLFWYVPIDDTSHMHVMVTSGVPEVIEIMDHENQQNHNLAADIMNVLERGADLHRDRGYALRRPDMVRLQDGVTVVGQGPIADRSKDHLGTTDAGVVLLRKLWSRALKRHAAGATDWHDFKRPTDLC